MPFIRYTLGTIINAYKDFEDRFILLEKKEEGKNMKFLDAEFVKGFIRMEMMAGSRDGMRETVETFLTV